MESNDNSRPDKFPEVMSRLYNILFESLREMKDENALSLLELSNLTPKMVKGTDYLYIQGRLLNGRQKQVYLGSRKASVLDIEEKFAKAQEVKQKYLDTIEKSLGALRALGVGAVPARSGRVIATLAEAGIFDLYGGVLLEDAAFYCLAQLHGLRLPKALDDETDIVVGVSAIPKVPKNPLGLLDKGYSPVNRFDLVAMPYYSREVTGSCGISFLCLWNEAGEKTALLQFLIKEPIQVIAFCKRPVIVTVPDSIRYFLFKIIRSQLPGNSPPVANMDLFQAKALFKVVREKLTYSEIYREARALNWEWGPLIARGLDILKRTMR